MARHLMRLATRDEPNFVWHLPQTSILAHSSATFMNIIWMGSFSKISARRSRRRNFTTQRRDDFNLFSIHSFFFFLGRVRAYHVFLLLRIGIYVYVCIGMRYFVFIHKVYNSSKLYYNKLHIRKRAPRIATCASQATDNAEDLSHSTRPIFWVPCSCAAFFRSLSLPLSNC